MVEIALVQLKSKALSILHLAADFRQICSTAWHRLKLHLKQPWAQTALAVTSLTYYMSMAQLTLL